MTSDSDLQTREMLGSTGYLQTLKDINEGNLIQAPTLEMPRSQNVSKGKRPPTGKPAPIVYLDDPHLDSGLQGVLDKIREGLRVYGGPRQAP